MSTDEAPTFTILLPVHRGPELLPFAIASVLAQRRSDFELVVICDGAPAATGECARRFADADPRVTVRDLPKGERNGELYRDDVLATARAPYVCQTADDDLWFPNHLDEMALLLEDCDFGNLTQTNVFPDGRLSPLTHDLSHPPTVERMLHRQFNFFGPTVCGYRLGAYRRLNERWSPAPSDIWSDLYMWRKFLRAPGIRAATRHVITSLSFPTAYRREWIAGERLSENQYYAGRIKTAAGRSQIRAEATRVLAARTIDQEIEIFQLRHRCYVHRAVGKAWRVLRKVLNLPG